MKDLQTQAEAPYSDEILKLLKYKFIINTNVKYIYKIHFV